MSKPTIDPSSALRDWTPEEDVVVFSATNHGTGIRQDEEVANATELIHRFSSAGTGVLITPSEIAELRIRNKRATWTTAQLSDMEFEVRSNLLPALLYDRGNGRRLAGTMLMPLNADDGNHATNCEYISFMSLEGTTAGSRVGRFGAIRLTNSCTDRRGNVHELSLKKPDDKGRRWLDTASIHELMIQGFVKGYAHLEDAIEDAKNLYRALATIRNATTSPDAPDEVEFIDRDAPRDEGY